MDAFHQHDHDDCGGGGVEARGKSCLRKTRVIVLCFYKDNRVYSEQGRKELPKRALISLFG